MPRYHLLIEYDGRGYAGWQRQANGPSIQGSLEAAGARLEGAPVTVIGAGRTDAGVHARAMSAHIDFQKEHPAHTVREAINYFLKPAPIAVLQAILVPDDFHARFSATARSYEYHIINRRARLALEAGRAWQIAAPLDPDAMNAAARALIGRHDFTTFRAAQCQARSPVRTLTSLSVRRDGDRIIVSAHAPSFLHNQVRSIVGSLVSVGKGKWPVAQMSQALAARDRAQCGPVAPPDGLYFMGADFADEDGRRDDALMIP